MLLLRVARMTTTWTKREHRDPRMTEPIFREGARVVTRTRFADGVATVPQDVGQADVLLVEDAFGEGTRLVRFRFVPAGIERRWALFGLRLEGEAIELWLRTGDTFFYGAPRRAEYRLAVMRPGDVTRVIHNAKNDFAAASGRDRTYRWSDFVFAPQVVREVCVGDVSEEWLLPLERAKTVDLREELL